MKKFIALFLFVVSNAFAQPSDYWQQHVSYTISGTLIDSIHSFDGKLSVVYTNNSPDTLHEVWFHLYYNAFQPGSMMYERAKALNDRGIVEKIDHYKRSDWGEQRIPEVEEFHAGHGANYEIVKMKPKFEVAGTIMKVELNYALPPHDSVIIIMPFFVEIPPLTRRGGWMNDAGIKYSMSQWYPKICEYDREGWHHQEYVAREFYGVYGDFDVRMNVPAKYCVGSTGQCQNPEVVGWGYDQIAHGIKKGKFYPDSVPSTQYSKLIPWHFKASNVHDFAWVAHEYIHEWDTWSDTVTVHCLYKPSEEQYWSEAMPNTFKMLDHHSKKVGWYQYRNFTNTHGGDGGMEYPQLIMDGNPGLGLIMHEGGHQWFYGMIGNNETRYAFLDEGFTEFIEMTGVEATYGRHHERDPNRDSSWLTRTFIPAPDMRRDYYRSYLDLAAAGYEEPLTIPHDWFRENINAGQVYFKTLAGLAQLEYVLGDSVFWAGMHEYFRRWHFHHPNLNDFKRTMQDVSGADLDYYFDEWFGSTRTMDYAACGLNSDKQDDGTYRTTVKLKNKSLGVAPIDLTLHYDDGSTGIATIPLSVNQGLGYKKPEAGRLFFPSWDWVSPEYKGSINTPKGVDWYEIDSSCRLMDLNRRNNTKGLFMPKTDFSLWKQLQMSPPLEDRYGVFRPILWYEEWSGLNIGAGLQLGQVRNSSGDVKLIFKTSPQRTSLTQNLTPQWYDYIDGDLHYVRNVKLLGNLTTVDLNVQKMYGLERVRIELDHIIRPTYLYLGPTQTIGFYGEVSTRGDDPNYVYPVYYMGGLYDGTKPAGFTGGLEDGINSTLGIKYSCQSPNGNSKVAVRLEEGSSYLPKYTDSFFGIDYQTFGGLYITGRQRFQLSREIIWSNKINFANQWGYLPFDRFFLLNGANSYEQTYHGFWQAVTSISQHFSQQSHFFLEGGGGVRGYSTLLVEGKDGLGLSTELSLPNPLRTLGWLPASFTPVIFGDAGWVGAKFDLNNIKQNLATDAGLGIKLDILSWLPWQLEGVANEYADIPSIGFYFPLYLNHPNDGKSNLAFRYAISLGTTF
jgi:hypothetical protein